MVASKKTVAKKTAKRPQDRKPKASPSGDNEILALNIDDLTVGDVEDIERETGTPWSSLFVNGQPSFTLVVAMVWLTKRKKDSSYTLDQARSIKITDLPSMERKSSTPT